MRVHRSILSIALLAVALIASGAASAVDPPQANVASGALQGRLENGVQAFLGIPYAQAPVGPLRWRAPQPPMAWHGLRDATQFGAACPQSEDRLYGLTPERRDEDCLYLNVWAPVPTPGAINEPLPVMVWLHGGAHRIGTASIPNYDGSRLAARGVIVVTLNYRLGYLGYFDHPALKGDAAGGNFGLMDQIAALTWVSDNITAFGGDPSKITIFGQSAGGADVLYLMTSAAARGLFRAAIVQSGGGWNKPLTREKMQSKVVAALETVGIEEDIDAARLRALEPQQLIAAQAADRSLGFGPFLDQTTVSEAPWQVFADGREAPVPLVIGSNDWEGNLLKFREPRLMDKLLTRLPMVADWYEGRAEDAAARRPLLFGDIVFTAPARWLAAHHAARAPTWMYRFEYVRSARRGEVPGAGHAAEIAYVFDTLDALQSGGAPTTDEDRRLATQLADCWAAFARSGKPRCELPWPLYDPQTDELLRIGREVQAVATPDAKALDGVTKYFGPGGWLGP